MNNRTRFSHRLILPTVSALAALGLSACRAEEDPTPDPTATPAVVTSATAAMGEDGGHEAAEMHDAMSDDHRMDADGQMNGMPHDKMPIGRDKGSNTGNVQPAPSPSPSSSMSMGEDM